MILEVHTNLAVCDVFPYFTSKVLKQNGQYLLIEGRNALNKFGEGKALFRIKCNFLLEAPKCKNVTGIRGTRSRNAHKQFQQFLLKIESSRELLIFGTFPSLYCKRMVHKLQTKIGIFTLLVCTLYL